MTGASCCPETVVLNQFLVGVLAGPSAEEVEAHLRQCPNCLQRAAALPSDDPVVAAMRAQEKPSLPQHERDLVEGLMIRVVKEQVVSRADTPSDNKTPTLPTLAAELFSVLPPSQRADQQPWLGNYRILRVLGHGGMGVVFAAEDTQLQRSVAVKVMRPEVACKPTARARFLREARATAALDHDHIVTIHQVGEEAGVPFLVMPLLVGSSLEEHLRQTEGPLPVGTVLRLGREIAAGLATAHTAGLIHRDIKPANIWLNGATRKVKILDFGLARLTSDERLTQSGLIVGTAAYMAPEQARGGEVGGRADLFSLGCILYRLCTSRLPWQGSDAVATLLKVASEPPQPIREINPQVPSDLADLVLELLAKDPNDRPASAAAVVDRIAELERHTTEQTSPPRAVSPPPYRGRMARFVWLVAGLVGALLAGVTIFVQTDRGTFRIETTDDAVQVRVEQNGKEIAVLDKERGTEVKLYAGEYRIKLGDERKDIRIDKDAFQITRGGLVVATISKVPQAVPKDVPATKDAPPAKDVPAKIDPAFAKWLSTTQGMSGHEQVDEVIRKLKETNPGFKRNGTYRLDKSVVTELRFTSDVFNDAAPLQALTRLTILMCAGIKQGRLTDLSPLRNLPDLKKLYCQQNPDLSDLSPLRGLLLTHLDCHGTGVKDLTPLVRMPLEVLNIEGTAVKDLIPLRNLPLRELRCDGRVPVELRAILTLESINGMPVADFFESQESKQ